MVGEDQGGGDGGFVSGGEVEEVGSGAAAGGDVEELAIAAGGEAFREGGPAAGGVGGEGEGGESAEEGEICD